MVWKVTDHNSPGHARHHEEWWRTLSCFVSQRAALIIISSVRAFLHLRESMKPWATRAEKRSARSLALISSRLPANFSLTRLQSSLGRKTRVMRACAHASDLQVILCLSKPQTGESNFLISLIEWGCKYTANEKCFLLLLLLKITSGEYISFADNLS